MNIKQNLNSIQEQIGKGVSLVVVSKYQTIENIKEAYSFGQRIFGENKIQDMCQKKQVLPNDVQWHMIGHIQSNKVKYMASFVSMIHSVDSFKLLQEIEKQAQKHNRVIDFLFQIKIAQEETKYGMNLNEFYEIINSEVFKKMSFVRFRGLMGMATNTNDVKQIESEFKYLKSIFDELKKSNPSIDTLSMGMSGDYRIAIACGSTMVRLGSSIFH